MHNHDDKLSGSTRIRTWYLQASQAPGETNEPLGQPQSIRMSHRGRPSTMYLAQRMKAYPPNLGSMLGQRRSPLLVQCWSIIYLRPGLVGPDVSFVSTGACNLAV